MHKLLIWVTGDMSLVQIAAIIGTTEQSHRKWFERHQCASLLHGQAANLKKVCTDTCACTCWFVCHTVHVGFCLSAVHVVAFMTSKV